MTTVLCICGCAVKVDEIPCAAPYCILASGMSASGQDPKGLEAKPASPTAATSGGDAHTTPKDLT